jgi:hypothetical protein
MYANGMYRPGLKDADFVCNCHQLHEYTYKIRFLVIHATGSTCLPGYLSFPV